MPVRITSKEAYHKLKTKTLLKRVLEQIKLDGDSGSCIADIAYVLGLEKSTVSPRFDELKKMRAIVLAGKRPSKATRINSEHWRYIRKPTFNIQPAGWVKAEEAAGTDKGLPVGQKPHREIVRDRAQKPIPDRLNKSHPPAHYEHARHKTQRKTVPTGQMLMFQNN